MFIKNVYVYVNCNSNIEQTFYFMSNWDGASLGVGALCKLHTLHIENGGTEFEAGL